MRSGFPRSQGGAYSAFQCRSNSGVLPSPQDISTAPVPVVQAENGIQNNMIATQYPGELRVAYTDNAEIHSSAHVSAQRSSYFGTLANENSVRHSDHNSGKQRECHRQNFSRHSLKGSNLNKNPGLQQRHLSSASSTSTTAAGHKRVKSCQLLTALLGRNNSDSKIPIIPDSSTTLSSSSEETNANSEVITIANFSDERKAQQVKGSSLTSHQQQVRFPSLSSQSSTENVRPGRKKKPPTNDDILDYIDKSIAESLAILTQKNRNYEHSSKDSDRVYSPQPDCIMPKVDSAAHVPTTSAPDKEDVERRSLNYAVTEQYTAALGQELERDSSKGSKANAKLTQRVEETGDCATSASETHSTGTLVSAEENSKYAAKIEPVESALVDFDLSVKKHLGTPSYKSEGEEAFSMNTVKKLLYEDKSDEDMPQLTTKLPNPEHVEVSFPACSENPMYEDISEDESQQIECISEYPQILREVAATCTKNEDESQVVLTSVPEKQTRPNQDLDAKDGVPDDRERHMTEWESGALKLVEAAGLDSVQPVTDVSEDLQTKSSSVAPKNKTLKSTSLSKNLIANTKKNKSIDDQQHCGVNSKKATAHSKLNSSLKIHNEVSIPINHSERLSNQTSSEDVGEDAGCVDSQTDLSMSLSKAKKHAPPYESEGEKAFSMNTVKNPLYEDISDNDMPQLATKFQHPEHVEVSLFEARSENSIYDDISEDESQQIECISGETSSPTQVPEPNVKHSPFEKVAYGLVQGQALMRTEIVADEELIPKKQDSPKTEALIIAQYSKTDPGFEVQLCPKHDSKKQENHSVSCSPYPVLTDEDEADDEMDDDWLFIPVVVSDLKFEKNVNPQVNVLDVKETGEQGRQCDTSPTHCPSPNPEASAFSPLEVFDTLATLQQMTAVEIKTVVTLALGRSTPEHEMDCEGEPLNPQNMRESVDSCETEDSLDYSPELERNFMTVSKKLLESSAPLPSETDVVVSAKEGESSEVIDAPKVQTSCLNKSGSLQRLRELIKVKAAPKRAQSKTSGKKISIKDEIITSSSDSDDECDQNCKKRAKRKRLFSSSSNDSEDAGNSRCGTVEKRFQNNGLPSRDLPAQQHQSKHHDSPFADLSHSTEECGQMLGTKAASENVQHNRQNVSKLEIITIHDTDSEDDNCQNYKKPSRKRFFSSGSDSDNDSCVEETRDTCGTVVSQCETAEEKIQETQLSIADSSLPQHPSKLNDTEFEEVKCNAHSDVSHSVKKRGELIETKGESENVQNMTNRQRTLKRRVTFCDSDEVVKKSCGDLVYAKNRPSTETAGHLCRTRNTQPHKNRLSSKESPEKQRQSADKEANSTLDPNHLIPRLLDVEPSQPAERVHKQGKNGTLPPKTSTVSSKNPDTCENKKPHLFRNKQGRFVPKPRPENNKHLAKENNIQASIPKSRTVSRQPPLPSQDGPSTSPKSLPSTSGQLSEARQRLAYSRNMSLPGETTYSTPPSKQGSSIPTQHLSSLKLHRSHSTPSTLNPYTNTKGSSFSKKNPSLLRERLMKECKERCPLDSFTTRRNRKTSLATKGDLRTLNDSCREARSGPSHRDRVPKQRRNSHKTTPPLMKRSRAEAIQRTNDIHRDPTVKPKGAVGQNYKWKNSDNANESIELDWEDQ